MLTLGYAKTGLLEQDVLFLCDVCDQADFNIYLPFGGIEQHIDPSQTYSHILSLIKAYVEHF